MKKALSRLLSLLLPIALILTVVPNVSAENPDDYLKKIKVDKSSQARVIVTTDGECDDQNSLRHMLLYANDMDIAGLVYSAAQFHFQGDGIHTLKEITPHYRCEEEGAGDLMSFRPMEVDEDGQGGWIHDVIKNEYAKDYKYLSQNDPNYPTPEHLLSVTKMGNVLFEGDVRFDTEGSNLIRDAILDNDSRLLYLQAWGGDNTIVRALISIHEQYKDTSEWEAIRKKVCDKVVFQRGFNQDHSWEDNKIAEIYPELKMMTTDAVSLGYNGPDTQWGNLKPYYQSDFMTSNIKFDHGEMMTNYHLMNDGAYYPNDPDNMQYGQLTVIDWGFLVMYRSTYDFMGEGDSPHWMPMISVGLRGLENPESFNYGTWAGRLGWKTASGTVIHQPDLSNEYDYIRGRVGGDASWDGGYSGFSGTRFGEQFFQDWAARADWTVNSFSQANHPAVVSVDRRDVEAFAGDIIDLKGSAYDPDGDDLDIKWWVYEAGSSYSGKCSGLQVWDADKLSTKFTVPADAKGGDYFNIILEVKDQAGQNRSFTRYAQVIIKIPDRTFRDVMPNSPYYNAAEIVNTAGVMQGTGNLCFRPEAPVTTKEMVAILGRMSGTEPTFEHLFESMSGDAWYLGYKTWAKKIGIIDANTDFNAIVTAAQIDSMISAYAKSVGKEYTAGSGANRGDLALRLASLLK